jgi:hypothetical protein
MFKIVCCSFAYKGMSWKGETGTPSFSMKHLNSFVCREPILRGWYSDGCLLYDMFADCVNGDEDKCLAMALERWEAMFADEGCWRGEGKDFCLRVGASARGVDDNDSWR